MAVQTGAAVIRQAISCDICGAEKRQTNHGFVAYEQAGELRVSGWSSRRRSRPGSKHLCGQTCLHKLVDDFMARAIAVRPPTAELNPAPALAVDTSLTSSAAYPTPAYSNAAIPNPAQPNPANPNPSNPSPVYLDIVSSPQPHTPAAPPALPQPIRPVPPEPAKFDASELTVPLDEPPHYASRTWRAEAWEREREREQRSAERRSDTLARRGA